MDSDSDAQKSSTKKIRSLRAFVSVCLLICIVFASLRAYVRLRIIRNFRKDDWCLVITVFFMLLSGIFGIIALEFGLGSHMSILSSFDKKFVLILVWISSVGYLFTVIILKVAFLLLYRRTFPLPSFQKACDIFMAFLCVWLLAGFITNFAICQPTHNQWSATIAESGRSCRQRYVFWMFNGVLHVVTDIIIFVMPLPMIKKLPLTTAQRVVLGVVFSLGILICVISIIRLTTLYGALIGTDPSWSMATTFYWSVGEATCAIICLCIPTLRPLIARSKHSRTSPTESTDSGPRSENWVASLAAPHPDVFDMYHQALRES